MHTRPREGNGSIRVGSGGRNSEGTTQKVPPNVLDLPLCLAVGLWMIPGCETYRDP